MAPKSSGNSRAYCGWFNFKGADQQKIVGLLSGGERNRVHLAKMLKEGGNVLLLLDEPTKSGALAITPTRTGSSSRSLKGEMTAPTYSLRTPRRSDAARLAELIEWEVARWTASVPFPYTLADAHWWLGEIIPAIEAGISRTCAIEIDGQIVGVCGIEPDARGMVLGFWLGRPYWGRGIMTAAAGDMVQAHFAEAAAPDLVSGYFEGNSASAAIQRRLGFVELGRAPMRNRAQGRELLHVDTVLKRAGFDPTCLR